MPHRAPLRFWGTALATSVGFAGGLAAIAAGVLRLEPRGGPILLTFGELWLLAVFCAGVLAVLLGLSAELGGWSGGGEARRGLERRLRAAEEGEESSGRDDPGEVPAPVAPSETDGAARWVMAVGAGLLGLYALGWWTLG